MVLVLDNLIILCIVVTEGIVEVAVMNVEGNLSCFYSKAHLYVWDDCM